MKKFLNGKTKASFAYVVIALLALITTGVYSAFTSEYGICNRGIILLLIGAVITSLILFLKNTVVDSYLEVGVSIFLSLSLGMFAMSSVGDYADAISKIVMFGSGAPIGGIITIDILMFVCLLFSFVSAGLRKTNN